MMTTTADALKQTRISAKNLGSLALENSCPRCFWLKMRLENHLPYQIFPGIFSSIDSYSKKVTNLHYAKHGRIPVWFSDYGQPVKVPHHSKFRICDEETGILLTGVPDEILRNDAGYTILDYKTAKFTENQDTLLPMYAAQLNAYSLIAEQTGMAPVIGLALVYYEPVTEIAEIDTLICREGFGMGFTAHILPIQRDYDLVPSLLAKAKAITDMAMPPESRDGCKDCAAVETMTDCLKVY